MSPAAAFALLLLVGEYPLPPHATALMAEWETCTELCSAFILLWPAHLNNPVGISPIKQLVGTYPRILDFPSRKVENICRTYLEQQFWRVFPLVLQEVCVCVLLDVEHSRDRGGSLNFR